MKKCSGVVCISVAVCAALLSVPISVINAAEEDGPIRLIVRADDIGSSHAANVACIQCFRDGIARSVEVMVPAPWFNEAVKMLNANPGYDVGVHLTLTAEWENVKWGPITPSPSLADKQGALLSHDQPTNWLSGEHGLSAGRSTTG